MRHLIGFATGVVVVIIFSVIVYGSVDARPGWTTAIGVAIWWGIAGTFANKADTAKPDQPESDD